MKQLYFLILTNLLALSVFSQYYPPSVEWQKSFGTLGLEFFQSIIPTIDGGYIAAGRTNANDPNANVNLRKFDALVVKFSGSGSILWEKTYGGTNGAVANSIQQTADGGFIVAGSSNSSNGDLTENKGLNDAWVFKLNSTGEIQWQKSYGTSGGDTFLKVRVTNDGGFILTGACGANVGDAAGNGFKGGLTDVWVVKLTDLGIVQWKRAYGSTSIEGANDIQSTIDGGFIICGSTNGNDNDVSGLHAGGPNSFRSDMWVIKIDNRGVVQWQKCLGGENAQSSGSFADDFAQAVQQTNDGGYIVAGTAGSIDGDITNYKGGISDGWVVKLSNTGVLDWQKTIGGSGQDYLNDLSMHVDGGFVVCGSSNSNDGDLNGIAKRGASDCWIIKLGASGSIQWQRIIGSSNDDEANSISLTTGDGFILAGVVRNNDFDAMGNPYRPNNPDGWAIKLSAQVLPLTITSISIFNTGDGILLSWKTANEINVANFGIERSSDGIYFYKIGIVPAKVNGSTGGSYTFIDTKNLIEDKLYYRLKLGDKDGSYVYSKVLEIACRKRSFFVISQNPVRDRLFLKVTKPIKQITIIDASGRVCLSVFGGNLTSIPTGFLVFGIYTLKCLSYNNTEQTEQFFKN